MQRDEHFRCQPVSAMGDETPAEMAAMIGHCLPSRGHQAAIIIAQRFGAAGSQALAGFRIPELGPAGIGEDFLGWIVDHDEMAANAAFADLVDPRENVFDRIEKIGQDDDLRMAAQAVVGREAVIGSAACKCGCARTRCAPKPGR